MIADKEGVSADYIMLGAGSGEMLAITGMSVGLEGGSVLSAWPTFAMLMTFAKQFNARWDKVNLDQYLTHDLDAMASAVKASDPWRTRGCCRAWGTTVSWRGRRSRTPRRFH